VEDLFHHLKQARVLCGLSCDKLISIITDSGKNMSGHNKGVVGRVNSNLLESGSEVPYTFHCHVYDSEVLQGSIGKKNNGIVISVINFIRKNWLIHHQFRKFSKSVEDEYDDVMYYCEVRWLNRWSVL
jgi:hypothetical protein